MTAARFTPAQNEFLQRTRRMAEVLDTDPGALRETYEEFCNLDMHTVCSRAFPVKGGSREWFELLTAVASASGALGWLAVQQWASNCFLARHSATPWPKVGAAIGQLRTGKPGIAPTQSGGQISGVVPWFSGSQVFDLAILGFFTEDGREGYIAIDVQDRTECRHSEPKALLGCNSTQNVALTLTNLPIAVDSILQVEPIGTRSSTDDQGALNQVPLSLGVCVRALEVIDASPRMPQELKDRCSSGFHRLFEAIVVEAERPELSEAKHELRAEATQLSLQLARIAAMASLPSGIANDAVAARLVREATFFSCVGGQNRVLESAVNLAFPTSTQAVVQSDLRLTALRPTG